MTDDAMDTMDCPVCGGDGFVECDDGSEVQCDRCNGTGRVPIAGDVQAAGLIHESGHQPSTVAAEASDTTQRAWRRWWRRMTGGAVDPS